MPAPRPMAFMSYARFDDEHNNWRLSEFHDRLSAEVQSQNKPVRSLIYSRTVKTSNGARPGKSASKSPSMK